MSKKYLVTIGGGSGQPELLRYLKAYEVDLTAMVTTMDSGGSTGLLRQQYDILSMGDVRKCLVALADNQDVAATWNFRFSHGVVAGHTCGNLILASYLQLHSMQESIDLCRKMLNISHTVLPITEDKTDLEAILENGQEIFGEVNIDIPKHDASLHIEKLTLSEKAAAPKSVIKAIASADYIVFTMGDLYTSILPNLLVDGVTRALKKTEAPLIAICNRTTKKGETHDFTTRNFYEVLTEYLDGAKLSYMLIDNGEVSVPSAFQKVVHTEIPADTRVIQLDLGDNAKPQYISGKKAAQALIDLCV